MTQSHTYGTIVHHLERALSYNFTNKDLALEALSHASLGEPVSNQRLEFLGDRVLALVLSQYLYVQSTDVEGIMAKRLNALVCRETCAQIGGNMGLGAWLRLSEGEVNTGGRRKAGILADACEAVIGAVFIDGGFTAAQKVIHKLWKPLLQKNDPNYVVPTDAKSRVQEMTQQRRLPLPEYKVVSRTGPDHAPLFTVALCVVGYEPINGQGVSKRHAEHAAAALFLQQESFYAA